MSLSMWRATTVSICALSCLLLSYVPVGCTKQCSGLDEAKPRLEGAHWEIPVFTPSKVVDRHGGDLTDKALLRVTTWVLETTASPQEVIDFYIKEVGSLQIEMEDPVFECRGQTFYYRPEGALQYEWVEICAHAGGFEITQYVAVPH